MKIVCRNILIGAVSLLWGASDTTADVRLPEVVSNNMVLQKDIPVPVWGDATPGEEIVVAMGEAVGRTTADEAGKWKVILPAMKTAGGPHEMSVKGKNEIKITNILVGEVWAGSGQS